MCTLNARNFMSIMRNKNQDSFLQSSKKMLLSYLGLMPAPAPAFSFLSADLGCSSDNSSNWITTTDTWDLDRLTIPSFNLVQLSLGHCIILWVNEEMVALSVSLSLSLCLWNKYINFVKKQHSLTQRYMFFKWYTIKKEP